jgi:Poly(R)-hydroxyalkanoic acid synthase subunit (PHA_synth_III_E)
LNPPAPDAGFICNGGRVSTNNPFQFWLDAALDPKLSDVTAASTQMMGAWTKAWQAALTGRALPAMELLNPAAWGQEGRNVADALESVLGTPQWSDFVSLDSETLKTFAPAVELVQIGQAYVAEVARVSADICRKFQSRLTAKGLKLDGSGEALDLWNDTVDEVLMAFNRSETFADLQRRFVRAMMAYRLEQRWLVGRLAEHYHLPTREEVDELARRVHDLERENRRLRRVIEKPSRSEA